MKSLLKFLLKMVGKTYEPDPNLPDGLILNVLLNRFFSMVRGILFLRRKTFIGVGTKIRGKGRIRFGRFNTIENYASIDGYASEGVVFGDRFKMGAYSIVSCTSHLGTLGKGITFGDDCGVGEFCYFGSAGGIKIGNQVIMGQHISFHSQDHNFEDKDTAIKDQGVQSKGIVVEDNVWIGAKATILDGAHIGSGCIVAAGAVVKGTFPSNCVIGGVPAKILKEL